MMYYFLTFRTYGTWLHGDERGSVDREHNQLGEPLLGPNVALHRYRRQSMKMPPVIFDEACQACVARTLREVALYRGWTIHALQVLCNHVHIVVQTEESPDNAHPEKVLATFKAWATRRLREEKLMPETREVWSHHGSSRYLKTEESLSKACHYVLYCQHHESEP